MPYCVRIARFMPRVEIVQRHNTTVRRLHIQGDNGKVSEAGYTLYMYMYMCVYIIL